MKEALVAGGGIAGMAAALGLARAGWQVTVCEEFPSPAEVGAGLQMSPNATKVLRWLGVLDAVSAKAFRPEAAELRDGRSGALIYHTALGSAAEARWGAPYLHVHRVDLLAALSDAVREAGVTICGGSKVDSYVLRPEGPALKLTNGETLTGDIVVGADGFRSAMRGRINGAEAPDFSGQIAWRGVIPAERLPEGLVAPNVTVWAGPGRHLVTYCLRGGSLVNFVAVEERPYWAAEGWSTQGNPDELRKGFFGWHSDVSRLLDQVDNTFLWGLFGRTEQVRWVDGPVVLIGDAAHPMLPFMAQGAAMALEDVAVLVRELQTLQTGDDLSEAMLAYEQRRWSRVTKVQQRSRANGRLFHQQSGIARLGRRGLISTVSRLTPGLAVGQLDWLYGHDATEGLG
jgi:salicylate hydroxylase